MEKCKFQWLPGESSFFIETNKILIKIDKNKSSIIVKACHTKISIFL